MSQDQFLSMINPLTLLRELTLNNITIKKIIRNRFFKEAVQLPLTLKKLKLGYIGYDVDPELFIQTINSHSNLVEFSKNSYINMEFLDPFYKPYPTLLNFEHTNDIHERSQSLNNIFEHNPQLTTLKLKLRNWNKELTASISRHLTNLEELSLSGFECNRRIYPYLFLEFTHPTRIKKLRLENSKYGDNLLNSIFLNCPHLEDLSLNQFVYYNLPDSESFINLKPAKIKKLIVECENLKIPVLDAILMNCPQLNELVINLPFEWKEALKSIYETCSNLQNLEISPPREIYRQIRSTFSRELRLTEFFYTSPKFKSTLTHLTLNYFTTRGSGADYYKHFEQLKSIKYPSQKYHNHLRPDIKPKINMELWPGYKLNIKDSKYHYDVEFEKILN
ncbi:hypothetical protein CONCODRAFT_11792 [Conidiobolus coronatus NRRL 28638]|uniref:RNI-like protein n=1 Tax=Conidiobolus coronatus (strain ATCC 28846 / CBS 209.66 / NRRL 28638) TaxID=796925 RepID=A0A137NUH9_CONC2|nr:hypothetical protein CONCODRAFT_11792 [Conidiobolus coronatus NRRL 28638]|eukprot:KXN66378.1 hypothetical protein CONCODRAFT_11792 [Conidiobolus coronatus NRRL 28638]